MVKIDGRTALYGIIGNPIEHTLSPGIHNAISGALGINAVYVPFKANGDLKAMVKGLYSLGVKGLNVTVPYKTEIIKELYGIDPMARSIGAVNTLKYTEHGYYGYNTDILGLSRELDDEGVELAGRHAVILGAGGAARAVAFLCASKRPASITIINRTIGRAQDLKTDVSQYAAGNGMYELSENVEVLQDTQASELKYDDCIVFQCTSVGLAPNDNEAVINDEEFYKKISTGVDLIYRPSETLFMKNVRKAGKTAHNGLKMLIYQAVSAYEIWNGISVPDEVVENLRRMLV